MPSKAQPPPTVAEKCPSCGEPVSHRDIQKGDGRCPHCRGLHFLDHDLHGGQKPKADKRGVVKPPPTPSKRRRDHRHRDARP